MSSANTSQHSSRSLCAMCGLWRVMLSPSCQAKVWVGLFYEYVSRGVPVSVPSTDLLHAAHLAPPAYYSFRDPFELLDGSVIG